MESQLGQGDGECCGTVNHLLSVVSLFCDFIIMSRLEHNCTN